MEYHCTCAFRNLKITQLLPHEIEPRLEDPWLKARNGEVIRSWEISDIFPAESITEEVDISTLNFKTNSRYLTDNRGVIHLGRLSENLTKKSVIYTRHTFYSENEKKLKLNLSYTDRFQLWCNDVPIFTRPPREWFHPERAKHGYSRLSKDRNHEAQTH